MSKTILITGSTDGIGLAAAKSLAELGNTILLHGRNEQKLAAAKQALTKITNKVETFAADLSDLNQVSALANDILSKHQTIDVLINNAGVFKTSHPNTKDGFDSRFMVNTIAPYSLTKLLMPIIPNDGRVVNLSSAAQTSVQAGEIAKTSVLSDGAVYAKSKTAITMWTSHMADTLGSSAPVIVAVNPASMLGSKMVQDAYGVAGGDVQIGADILVRAAFSEEFATASGKYFDNDIGAFASPHPDALNKEKCRAITEKIENIIANFQK